MVGKVHSGPPLREWKKTLGLKLMTYEVQLSPVTNYTSESRLNSLFKLQDTLPMLLGKVQ